MKLNGCVTFDPKTTAVWRRERMTGVNEGFAYLLPPLTAVNSFLHNLAFGWADMAPGLNCSACGIVFLCVHISALNRLYTSGSAA
jgi:hypothetical protein